jgi:hypothetical protein
MLATVCNLADWSGVQCPPEPIDDNEAICNMGPYLRVKTIDSWMYWVRQPVITNDSYGDNVARITREVWHFRKELRSDDVTPLNLVHTNVNAIEFETPLTDLNEAVFSRIELTHNHAECSTEMLRTALQLDLFVPGHTKYYLCMRSYYTCALVAYVLASVNNIVRMKVFIHICSS